jgi:hypothetical protein
MNQALYERLCDVARRGQVTRYSEVAPLVGLDMSDAEDRDRISVLLDEISRHEHAEGHPLLSAVVIHMDDNIPGNGFFTLASQLGLFRGGDRFVYFVEELRRVHDHWRRAGV